LHLEEIELAIPNAMYQFDAGYRNGRIPKAVKPSITLPLDLTF
jgi:hypothetical protein